MMQVTTPGATCVYHKTPHPFNEINGLQQNRHAQHFVIPSSLNEINYTEIDKSKI